MVGSRCSAINPGLGSKRILRGGIGEQAAMKADSRSSACSDPVRQAVMYEVAHF